MAGDFDEIKHSGGKVTFEIETDKEGRIFYSVGITMSAPVPSVLIGIYALPPGLPVATMILGGMGERSSQPPFPNCLPVYIASDSHGKFGHRCPNCKGYWRSGPWPNVCPYCALTAPPYEFLSDAQDRYVNHYCSVLASALHSETTKRAVIDMDAVAAAVVHEGETPSFYASEQSQQRKFTCGACDEFNDILGRFGYCSSCGTRNDLADFEQSTMPTIRDRLNVSTNAPEDSVRDAVAAFDSYMAQFAKQLSQMVPMTEARRNRLTKQRFHDFAEVRTTFKTWFDIDLCEGMKERECSSVALMFRRRHVYEHNGGEVDQKYLDDSGDTTVCLKQHIHETQRAVHMLLGSLVKMARNMHNGFQQLFPPNPEPIKAFEEKKAYIAKWNTSRRGVEEPKP